MSCPTRLAHNQFCRKHDRANWFGGKLIDPRQQQIGCDPAIALRWLNHYRQEGADQGGMLNIIKTDQANIAGDFEALLA
jgi:hypothetical protein